MFKKFLAALVVVGLLAVPTGASAEPQSGVRFELQTPWQVSLWNLLALQYAPQRGKNFTGNISIGGRVLLSDGTDAEPSLSFTTQDEAGLYSDGSNRIILKAEDLADGDGCGLTLTENETDGTGSFFQCGSGGFPDTATVRLWWDTGYQKASIEIVDGPFTSTTTFDRDETTFSDPVELPLGTAVASIASGQLAFDGASTGDGACTGPTTAAATGTTTSDVIKWTFSADPTAVTGYDPSGDVGYIVAYPTADTVNFKFCNKSGNTIDPGSVTLNWRVDR